MRKFNRLLAIGAIAIALPTFSASRATATQYKYDLDNKSGGNYGLYIFFQEDALEDVIEDAEFDSLAIRFDFDDSASTMQLVYDDVARTVNVSGRVRGYYDPSHSSDVDDDDFNPHGLSTIWSLNMTYNANVQSNADGSNIRVSESSSNMGSLKPIQGPYTNVDLFKLLDKNDNNGMSFSFNPKTDTLINGVGWFSFWVRNGGDGTGDFNFSARRIETPHVPPPPPHEIPEPATMLLLGSAALGLPVLKRRRAV